MPDCTAAGINWHMDGWETVYQSYPDPNSPECQQFGGCMYAGDLQACANTSPQSQSWIQSHNIVAVYPSLATYQYHWICMQDPNSGNSIAAMALDTCNDSDCNGCCTQNLGNHSILLDVEFYTEQRFTNMGINYSGTVYWADMGAADPSAYAGCN
jgi:hypothetical protein